MSKLPDHKPTGRRLALKLSHNVPQAMWVNEIEDGRRIANFEYKVYAEARHNASIRLQESLKEQTELLEKANKIADDIFKLQEKVKLLSNMSVPTEEGLTNLRITENLLAQKQDYYQVLQNRLTVINSTVDSLWRYIEDEEYQQLYYGIQQVEAEVDFYQTTLNRLQERMKEKNAELDGKYPKRYRKEFNDKLPDGSYATNIETAFVITPQAPDFEEVVYK